MSSENILPYHFYANFHRKKCVIGYWDNRHSPGPLNVYPSADSRKCFLGLFKTIICIRQGVSVQPCAMFTRQTKQNIHLFILTPIFSPREIIKIIFDLVNKPKRLLKRAELGHFDDLYYVKIGRVT